MTCVCMDTRGCPLQVVDDARNCLHHCSILSFFPSPPLARNPECTGDAVRLTDRVNEREGRLQVCMGGMWGTVCDSNNEWGPEEANIACGQLGFSDKGKTYVS